MNYLNEVISEYNEVLESLNKEYRLVKNKFDTYPAVGDFEDYKLTTLCLQLGAVEASITGIRKEMKEISKQFTKFEEKELSKYQQIIHNLRLKLQKVGV